MSLVNDYRIRFFPIRWMCWIAGMSAVLAVVPPGHQRLPDLDRRLDLFGAARAAGAEHRAAVARLQSLLPGIRIDLDPLLGTPRWIAPPAGFLTGPNGQGLAVDAASARRLPPGEPHRAVKNFLNEHAGLFGHDAAVLDTAQVSRDYLTPHNGMRSVVWRQELDGLPVFEGLLIAHTTRNGELVSLSSRFMPDAAKAADRGIAHRKILQAAPAISDLQAVARAAENLGDALTPAQVIRQGPEGPGEEFRHYTAARVLNGAAHARLVWLPLDRATLRLCWEVLLTSRTRNEMFRVLIDAATGEVWVRRSLTSYASEATYRVYTSDSPSPFSPGHPVRSSAQPPYVARALVVTNALNPQASPHGWINDGDNETRGNNADAHLDADNDDQPDLPRPQGSPARVLDFPLNLNLAPAAYANAAVVQLFYWNNWMHDQLYALGFTEAAGNFQVDNFGRGGRGNDAVQADAQDGGGFNNANFYTPPDGLEPRMQMYLWDGPTPHRDGDLDAEIILHEYTHGLSNRRVGGGVGISALQTAGMGEGWSDFYALALLSEESDDLNGNYAAGAYSTLNLGGLRENYYFGIRRYPYSTDLTKSPLTFKDIDPGQADPHPGVPQSPIFSGGNPAEVHNQGEVWCVTLWEVRAGLIRKHGFAAGNRLTLQLVTDGMNLSPANPNFLEARDAILQADQVNTGGANFHELWAAFAKRGMGYSASSPSSATTSGVIESYDVPDDLLITPREGLTASGPVGGSLTPAAPAFLLANASTNALSWTADTTAGWLDLVERSGTLAPGETGARASLVFNPAAAFLPAGTHQAQVFFTDRTSGSVQRRTITVSIGQPDSLTARFDRADRDLSFHALTFIPDGSPGFYAVCREPADHFPNEPRLGKQLQLGDDDFETITLAGSARIALFGRRTNVFHIGANGYLTLGSGDQTAEPTFDAHFDRPRISALFADLIPPYYLSTVGGVGWQQLGDRVVVTWWNVPQQPGNSTNNVQMELFFDGRIRLTYLDLSVTKALVGLSRGQGIPPGFAPSDLNADGGCLPRLSVTLPLSAAEGDGRLPAQGQVRIPQIAVADLTITLLSSDAGELVVPATVVIPAGQTSATFDVTVIDDPEADGTQLATVTASAPGYADGTAPIYVRDNETAALTLTLPATVGEGVGTAAGRVALDAPATSDVVVQLFSSNPAELQVPLLVLIRAGTRAVDFLFTLADNATFDAFRQVTLTARVEPWPDATATVTIADDEPHVLAVRVPARASEAAGLLPLAGSVRIVAPLPTNLVVTLASDNLREATTPAEVVIPAGQTAASFHLTMIDDATLDGDQPVVITARSPGWTEGQATLISLDNETPPAPGRPDPPDRSTGNSVATALRWNFSQPGGELVANGNFERGSLAEWTQENDGLGGFRVDDGNYDPAGPEGTSAPRHGGFAAVCQQFTVGTFAIWQEVTLPADAAGVVLRWADKIRNYGTFGEDQQFRVEIRDTNGTVLALAYATKRGDSSLAEWTERSYDLAAFRGQTIRVAFVEQNGLFYFNVHLDDISVQVREGGRTDYDVYFGTGPSLGPAQRLGRTTNTFWTLPPLAPLSTYYWQVVASRTASSSGPIWQFTTRGVDHFSWSPVAPTQHIGVPLNATVTARDELDRPVPGFRGPVSFDLLSAAEDPGLSMLSSASPDQVFNSGTFTLGYAFTVSNDLQVTHVRHYSGIKVSIWTDDGTLLLSQTVAENDGHWSDTALPSPFTLRAGTRYRVGVLTGGNPYYGRYDMGNTFPHGTILDSYYSQGDDFPSSLVGLRWPFVDLRFELGVPPTYLLSPTASGSFVNGAWTGPLTPVSLATNVVVRARDDEGHSGSSEAFLVTPGPGVLDHFEWTTVPSPQFIGQPFAVRLTAKDSLGGTVSNFDGSLGLSGLGDAPGWRVGNGAEPARFPLSAFFEDARCQVIYRASELGGPQRFTALALNVSTAPGQPLNRWTIRIKPTSLNAYNTPYPSFESFDWTIVHQANAAIEGPGWVIFPFRQPFDYDGTQNLLIDFSFRNDSYTFDGEVLSTPTDESRTIVLTSDGTQGDPLSWSSSYPPPLAYAAVPNLQLFTSGPALSLSPATAGPFTAGVWSGNVQVDTPASALKLSADDHRGRVAVSNPFSVGARNDLSLVLTSTAAALAVGERVTFTITLSNSGPGTATSVVVTNVLPANLGAVSTTTSQGTFSVADNSIRFALGALSPGATARSTVTAVANAFGQSTDVARVTRAESDGFAANDSAALAINVGARALSVDDAIAYEGDGETTKAVFHLQLSIPSPQSIAIRGVTADGTAIAGSDYVATNALVTFAPGETNRTLAVAILGDTVSENYEYFHLNLTGPAGVTLTRSQARATIYDNDPYPSLSINDVSVVEGNSVATNAVFTVTLSAPSGQTVSVNYATRDGSATAAQDYVATFGSLTFAPGQSTATIRVPVLGDSLGESNEFFSVKLSDSAGAYFERDQGFCTIVSDDIGPVIIAGATQVVADTNQNHVVDAGERVTVNFTLRNIGTAAATNLVATLLPSGGVSKPDGPQTYGALSAGTGSATRAFTFTATGTNGGNLLAAFRLQDGPALLGVVTFSIVLGPRSEFHVETLSADPGVTVEHGLVTGQDRGGIAASAAQIFYTGDTVTGRFAIEDLTGGMPVGTRYDALTSDLRTETAYTLGDGGTPLSGAGGTVTSLLALDGQTGALTGSRINLSTAVTLPYDTGIFAGHGRVVLHTGDHVYEIALPSGTVRDLGAMARLAHRSCGSWAYWGVAEHLGSTIQLICVADLQTITRTRVPDGLTSPVATFSNLGDMCSFTVSLSQRRWYFHYRGYSQFGYGDEILGFCDATFRLGTVPELDHLEWGPWPTARLAGQAIPATLSARDQFGDVYTNFAGPALLSATAAGGVADHTLLESPVPLYTNQGPYTLGYAFTPATNLTVTHVRHICGTKVSIWNDDGRLLATVAVNSLPGTWLETPLASPLELHAGTRYRVSYYTGGDAGDYFYRFDRPSTFHDGTIDGGYESYGDTFPTFRSGGWWLVDLHYSVQAERPLSISPTAAGPFIKGVWAGSITVMQPGSNVVLQAADHAGHRARSPAMRVLASTSGGLDHFEWNTVPSPQTSGAPIAVTLIAKTDLDELFGAFNGSVTLSARGLAADSFTLRGGPPHEQVANNGNFTLGYTFTSPTDLTVTHVRHYSGAKVSIWDSGGTLLSQTPVQSVPGTWMETPLAAPLPLQAGSVYLVSFLTDDAPYYFRSDITTALNNVTIGGSFYAAGDGFPDNAFPEGWWLVDLRYQAIGPVAIPVQPAVTANFNDGSWTGSLHLLREATAVILHAETGGGALGDSEPFTVLASPSPRLAIARSGGSLIFSWPAANPGYALEAAAELSPASSWSRPTGAPVLQGDRFTLTIANPGHSQFYRLQKP